MQTGKCQNVTCSTKRTPRVTACTARQRLFVEHLSLSLISRKLVETICLCIADFELANGFIIRPTCLSLAIAALSLPVHTTGVAGCIIERNPCWVLITCEVAECNFVILSNIKSAQSRLPLTYLTQFAVLI